MPYDSNNNVFVTLEDFYEATKSLEKTKNSKIIHCINPFPAQPGSEHARAQSVTLASMRFARAVSAQLCPDVEVKLAAVTTEPDTPVDPLTFDIHREIESSVLHLKDFQIPRPLPLLMDILTAVEAEPDDIFVFTNVDIAVAANFYAFIDALFAQGADCAIINRRTISNVYRDEGDLWMMAGEVGKPHPGFDCLVFRGNLRDSLMRYDSCVGIGGVMLPLVHQLLAIAERPVVLLDAHASFHLGDDKTWNDDRFTDYTEHNRNEIDRVFSVLMKDGEKRDRLVARLGNAHKPWVFPPRLRRRFDIPQTP